MLFISLVYSFIGKLVEEGKLAETWLNSGPIALLVLYVVAAIGLMKIYEKAGKKGWYAFIPVLNDYVSYDICWIGWLGLVALACSVVANVVASGSVVFYIFAAIAVVLGLVHTFKLAKSFGKGFGFGLGLLVFPYIFTIILGFGSAKYVGKE